MTRTIEPLDWEFVSGREDVNGDPDPEQRYRIYRLCPGETEPELVFCCPTEAAVGVALCTGAREGEFDPDEGDCAIGILVLDSVPKAHPDMWDRIMQLIEEALEDE